MGEFLKRLFDSDLMPHGRCWGWEPWVVGWNVVPDALIAFTYMVIALALIHLARRRKDIPFDWVVVMFAVFTFACGCTHAMEVYNTWHGAFRIAGVIKAFTAAVSLVTMIILLRITPKLRAAPTLDDALAMDAALTGETMRKRHVEGQLKASQDRFQMLVDGILDYAVFMMDPQGRITSWNPGAERMTGYTEGEAMGAPFSRLFPEEDIAAGVPATILAAAASSGRLQDEGWRIRKDGSRFLTSAVITAFFDARGQVQGFSKVTRDITEQRAIQAELRQLAESLESKVEAQVQELRESEARVLGFIRHAPAAIAFKDLDGRFMLINPKMEAMVGHPCGEVLGHTAQELFPDGKAAQTQEMDQRVVRHRQAVQHEQHWTDNQGATRHALVHRFPLVDQTGRCWGLGVIATDITEARQADQSLLQTQKLESLGVLTGGIAHDFNNLLGAMLGNVELALTEGTLSRALPHLEALKGLMVKASDLLKRMLAYAGQGKSTVAVLDLNQLVVEMTTLLGSSISKKAVIHHDLHPGALPMEGDPAQIQQLVMNLVINASEAFEDRNGTITLRTWAEDLEEPLVSLEVADTGVGMTPEVLAKIFDPFFTTKFTGRGLGLAAIHGIVRGHRGFIRARSEPGVGSAFTVQFPASRDPVPPALPDPLPPGDGDPARLDGTVLVVDDEDAMRAITAKALRRLGLRTLQARDGLEALTLHQLHGDRIRLVLMDLTMPNMDGVEASRELRRRDAAIPIILTSGFNETAALKKFEGLELAGFLQKPFGLQALTRMVRRVLEGR